MAHIGGGTTQGALRLSARTSPGISPAGQGWIYFDQATNSFVVSEDGGAYVPLLSPSTAGGWTDDGTIVRLTTSTDAVSVGTASPPASTKFHVVGDSSFKHVSLTGGQGAASAPGGNVTVTTGAGGATSGASGDLTLSTGTTTDGDGGDVLLVAAAGNGTDRNGGNVSVTCGASSGNGSAGSFIVTAGTPTNTGAAGFIQIVAGNATGGASGGGIDLRAGGGGINGDGGELDFRSGNGGITSGAGGQASLRSGSAVAGNDPGGDFEILAGDGFGTGDGGNVLVGAGSGGAGGAAGRVSVSTDGVERVRVTGAGRVGLGTTSPVATLDVDGSMALGDVATINSSTTLDDTHAVVLIDASGGPVTVTLPSVSGIGRRRYVVKKIDSSANAVTVAASGAEMIDGTTSKTLAIQYEALEVVTNGTAWFVI